MSGRGIRPPAGGPLGARRPGTLAVASGLLAAALLLGLAACGKGGAPEQAPEDPAAAKQDKIETSTMGAASKVYPCTLPQAAAAARSALKALNIRVTDESGGIFKTSLDAESRDGTSVTAEITETTKTTTRIEIKVGRLMGDVDAARRIHSEIESELAGTSREKPGWGGRGFPGFGAFSKPAKPTPDQPAAGKTGP
jgi:predicted small lipoprotein YifL